MGVVMRKRAAGRPRVADPAAFLRAIGMQHTLDASQQTDLVLAVRAAAGGMRAGVGVEHHVHALASAVNLALILCERGVGREYQQTVIDAQLALIRSIERGRRSARWGFDGPAIAQIEAALEVYEAQLAVVAAVELRDAVREVTKRVNQGHVFQIERPVQ